MSIVYPQPVVEQIGKEEKLTLVGAKVKEEGPAGGTWVRYELGGKSVRLRGLLKAKEIWEPKETFASIPVAYAPSAILQATIVNTAGAVTKVLMIDSNGNLYLTTAMNNETYLIDVSWGIT